MGRQAYHGLAMQMLQQPLAMTEDQNRQSLKEAEERASRGRFRETEREYPLNRAARRREAKIARIKTKA